MAKFCTKCGSTLAENLQSCPTCGTAVASAPGPARATSIPPAVATPGFAGGTGAPAAKAGSPAVKIILIVVGVLMLLTVVGIGSCFYVVHRARQRVHEITAGRTGIGTPDVEIEKGGAGSEAEEVATSDVPPYPGSTATEAGGSFGAAGIGIAAQEYSTSDSVDQVVAFYKGKLGSKLTIQESGGNAILQVKTGANAMTNITITRDEGAGQTKINIMRIGK